MKKNYRMLLILGLLLGQWTSLKAQEKGRLWQHALGYENVLLKDIQTSPLLYAANNIQLNSEYLQLQPNAIWKITLMLSVGNSQSSRHGRRIATLTDPVDIYGGQESWEVESNPILSYVHGSLSFSFMPKISLGNQELYLGAELGNDFYQSGIGLDTWFFNNLSFSPSLAKSFVFGDWEVPVALSFPVLSMITRAPYAKDPSVPLENYIGPYLRRSEFASIGSFQKIESKVGLNKKLKSGNTLGVYYSFYWLNHYDYASFQAVSNTIGVFFQH